MKKEKVSTKILESCQDKALQQLSKKNFDEWDEMDMSNWVLCKLNLSEKVASLMRESHVTGEMLMKNFKDEYDLDSLVPQANERSLIFKEKENLRSKLEMKKGEIEEQESHESDVFISYCWQNSELVRSTAKKLEEIEYQTAENEIKKIKIWIDIKNMKGDIYNSMENGVRNCKIFLSFISPKYASSPNCQRELKLGNDLRKKVFCCLADPANRFENGGWPPPGIGTLVAGNLYIDLTKDFDTNFGQLVSQIQQILSGKALPSNPPAPSSSSSTSVSSSTSFISTPPVPSSSTPTPSNASSSSLDAKLDQLVSLFNSLSSKMEKMESKMEYMEEKIKNIESNAGQMRSVMKKFDQIEEKINNLEEKIEDKGK